MLYEYIAWILMIIHVLGIWRYNIILAALPSVELGKMVMLLDSPRPRNRHV